MATALRLLVFLHVAVKQRALQTELAAAMGGIVVTAVGRIADFDRALQDGQDAVLTLPVVLAAYGLAPALRGIRQGSPEERYALVAVDVVPDPARISSVGALDLLGRERTNAFVHGLLGANPKVERVTKVEDLLPLLQMQRVDAILLAARMFTELEADSRLKLAQRTLAATVGLPAAAKVGAGAVEVLAALKRLPGSVSSILGVDEWR